MKKEVTTAYVCELCHQRYDDEKDARRCEKGHVPADKLMIIGVRHDAQQDMPEKLIVTCQVSKHKKEEYFYEYCGQKGVQEAGNWVVVRGDELEEEPVRKKKR